MLQGELRTVPIKDFIVNYSKLNWFRDARKTEYKAAIEHRNWDTSTDFREYQMAFVLRTLIQEHDVDQGRAWRRSPDQIPSYMRYLTNLAANSTSPADEGLEGGADAFFIRTAYQQFGDFEDLGQFFGRSYLLLGECAKQAETENGIKLDDVLMASRGLTIREAYALAFGFFSSFMDGTVGPHFNDGFLTQSPEFPGLTPERLRSFVEWLSLDLDGFRDACVLPAYGTVEGFDAYNLNPLIRFPILQLEENLFVAPSPRMLFRRVTTGLFYDLIAPAATQRRVGAVIGRAIELYTRLLLSEVPSIGPILPEQRYEKGQSTSEWIIDDAEATVIVECKRRSILQRAKTTGREDDLLANLTSEDGVVDGVAKLLETAAAIRNAQISGINRAKPIIALLVTLDHLYCANTPYMRDLIEQGLAAKGLSLDGLDLQVCPVSDLEDLVWHLHASGESLSRTLKRKISEPYTRLQDVSVWTRSCWPQENGTKKGARIPCHDRAWDEGLVETMNSVRGGRPALTLEQFRQRKELRQLTA